MPITLSDEDAIELASEIQSLMNHYDPCSYAADYVCEFCGTRKYPSSEMIHKPNCSGQKFLALLQKTTET